MRNYFTFNGVASTTYGVYLSGSGVFNSPERAVDFITVPGRNGAVIGSEDRFENVELTYPCFIFNSFKSNIRSLKNALLSVPSYARLEDTYNNGEFRQAIYVGALEVEPTRRLDAGEFELTFICKPQRWLSTGENTVLISSSGTSISNPTVFKSLPKIEVFGYGDVYVGSQKITITNAYPSVVIDSEIGDCYYSTNNANSVVSFGNKHFPVLLPGNNAITFPATVSQIIITPRWWRV